MMITTHVRRGSDGVDVPTVVSLGTANWDSSTGWKVRTLHAVYRECVETLFTTTTVNMLYARVCIGWKFNGVPWWKTNASFCRMMVSCSNGECGVSWFWNRLGGWVSRLMVSGGSFHGKSTLRNWWFFYHNAIIIQFI